MSGDLDSALLANCTPAHIREIFQRHKADKLDRLRAEGLPTVADLLMSQGESLEHIFALDDLVADFPEVDVAVSQWGKKKQKHRLIQIPIGADGITYQAFERDIDHIAAQVARRIATGRYLFYPFREVEILKDSPNDDHRFSRAELETARAAGQTRTLAVASLRDVIVQQILYRDVLLGPAERLFGEIDRPRPVSYAYRPGSTPQNAVRTVMAYARFGYSHVLDADLAKFFDTIPHAALLTRCQEWLEGNPLTFDLVRRFLRVDRVPYASYAWDSDGRTLGPTVFRRVKPRSYVGDPRPGVPQRCSPEKGIPQGGVLSGLLANFYLHPFDQWMIRELGQEFDLKYVRYADDFVVLTRSKDDVFQVYERIREKLESPWESGGFGLRMHPLDRDNPSGCDSKTRYVELEQMPLRFVGFEVVGTGRNVQLRINPKKVERFVKRWEKIVDSERELIGTIPDPADRLLKVVRARLRPKVYGYRWVERCSVCGEQWTRSRSWISFYRCTTDWRQVLELDQRLRKIIYQRFRPLLPSLTRSDLTKMGLPSLMREYRRAKRVRPRCRCETATRNRANVHTHAIDEGL
jgi:RNA-directed DNA polymerase